MKYALIDIGSNTIRLVIYNIQNGTSTIELNTADHLGLLSYVSNGEINNSGKLRLISILKQMKKISIDMSCDLIYAFATASLRNVSDKDSLVEEVFNCSGIKIDMLSGEQEAIYDFHGLENCHKISSGIAFDLGGGSCQLMSFKSKEILEYSSMPIGSLLLYNKFVSGDFPTLEEQEKISNYVFENLSVFKNIESIDTNTIYAMGGATRAFLSLSPSDSKTNIITKEQVKSILSISPEYIEEKVPKRKSTIIPAAITVLTILNFCKCEKIHVTDCGVRDGILYELINKSHKSN